MKKSLLWLALWLPMLLHATVYVPSTVPDPKQQGQEYYVSNPDAIIADSDVVWLNRCAERLNNATRVELSVVALESIGDADVFNFGYELFQRWGIGRHGQNTGVLMLFVLDSHDIRIVTGTGIEGVLTDARCSQIIHEDMIPSFQEGDYGGGLCLGVLRIFDICSDGNTPEELLSARSVTNRGQYADESVEEEAPEWLVNTVAVILVLLTLFGIGYLIWKVIKFFRNGCSWDDDDDDDDRYSRRSRSHSSSRSSSRGSWGGGSTSGGGAGAKW